MSLAESYARSVVSGKQLAGELVTLACKRFLSDLKRKDIYFDEEEANKIILFAENYCCLWEDKWRGVAVDVRPWMAFLWQNIYGWFKKDGTRRFKKVYIQIAKKNAKTTIAGVTANFHLFADDRVNTPKIFVGANNEDQAKICVNITGKIIEQSPELFSYVDDGTVNLFKYKENIVNIVHKDRDGFIKALSKESGDKTSTQSGGKHGINPSLGIIDEYALAANDDLLNTLESAQAARTEPLMFVITTAGFNKYGPCYTKLRDTGVNVLRGTMEDDSFFVLLYEHDSEDEYKDETTWVKSNPNIDVSVNRDFLRGRLLAAKNEGGSKEVDVKTLNFNMWVDAPTTWIQADIWNKNIHGIKLESLKGRECFGGLYTASTESVNVFILYFPDVEGKHVFYCHGWLPEDFALQNSDKVDYQKWIDEGFITVTPGNTADHKRMSKDVVELCQQYDVLLVGFDRMFGTYTAPELDANGIPVLEVYQGYNNLGQQTEEIKRLALKEEIEHFGNKLVAWHIANTVTHRNSDGIEKPDKAASGSRIGSVSAILNAMVAKFNYYQEGVMTDMTFTSLK